ncbi:MAG TPA: ACT domain-containing protein [Thermoflexia bacterium]|nr:ACT domain-containing protein [Thermoflexia bacterium]
MQYPPGLRHLLAKTKLFTDAKDYVIMRLPVDQVKAAAQLIAQTGRPFTSLVRDKDEVTLVLPRNEWEALAVAIDVIEESTAYRLITFDLPLELELVGYLATMTSAVAAAGVSVLPLASFSRDHIFVPAEDFKRAWDALRALIHTCQLAEAAERH